MILRLRESGGRAVLTWKGREIPGPHKCRFPRADYEQQRSELRVAARRTLVTEVRKIGGARPRTLPWSAATWIREASLPGAKRSMVVERKRVRSRNE